VEKQGATRPSLSSLGKGGACWRYLSTFVTFNSAAAGRSTVRWGLLSLPLVLLNYFLTSAARCARDIHRQHTR
jgi:hypothetical protein